jgi:hypothetical protein
MPKLLLFNPCEKVIIAEDHTVSLITIFETIQIHLPRSKDDELPENALIPLKWFVYSVWLKQPGDEDKTFEQLVDVEFPGGRTLKSEITEFQIPKNKHRNVILIPTFPVTPPGFAKIKLSLREQGQQDWVLRGEYPLEIERPVP